jgi:alpha-tubulin suppressor-like RCC1 family protein
LVWLSAGGGHTCVMGEGFEIWCWGENSTGALGDGTTEDRPWSKRVQFPEAQMVNPAVGRLHACALSNTTLNIYCWGDNTHGQLGDGTTMAHLAPEQVANLGHATIGAGTTHTCAIGMDGAWCWGGNASGQLGDGTIVDRSLPTPVYPSGVTPRLTVMMGLGHTCATDSFDPGHLYCWGDNTAGQLGTGTFVSSSYPVQVSALGNSVVNNSSIGGGVDFSCAVLLDKTLWCWGANSFGQLGDGTTTSHPSPQKVVLVTPAVPGAPRWAIRALAALLLGAAVARLMRRGPASPE